MKSYAIAIYRIMSFAMNLSDPGFNFQDSLTFQRQISQNDAFCTVQLQIHLAYRPT